MTPFNSIAKYNMYIVPAAHVKNALIYIKVCMCQACLVDTTTINYPNGMLPRQMCNLLAERERADHGPSDKGV